jgi:hypothetical protein
MALGLGMALFDGSEQVRRRPEAIIEPPKKIGEKLVGLSPNRFRCLSSATY